MPLSAYEDHGAFKVYMLDVGMLCSKFDIAPPNRRITSSRAACVHTQTGKHIKSGYPHETLGMKAT